MAPIYWLNQVAKPGRQTPEQLITTSPLDMAHHTVIVAQSGSGKSFFLGRVLEELALKTRGRLLVLDPNADFRRIADVVPESWWENAKYDLEGERGRLPHEMSRTEFEPIWQVMKPKILSGPYLTPQTSNRLKVSWNAFPIAFLAEELDAIARSQVYHCHEFVKSIAIIEQQLSEKDAKKKQPQGTYPFDRARKLLQRARHEGARQTLEEEFSWTGGHANLAKEILANTITRWLRSRLSQARERAISAVEFISPEIERFYFGRAKEYVAEGIVANSLSSESFEEKNRKIQVIDLPSFHDPRTQHVVLSSVVETAWDSARQEWAVAFAEDADKDKRAPLFIVLEEAHNIVPNEAQSVSSKALREQFRTIAAEGRKYGIFLILCTQRPDKIDPTIISECENRAVMRIGSRSVLNKTRELLGLESVPDDQLRKCLEFQTGRFLLVGPWAGENSRLGYSAMRRTVEGGRNLRKEAWAVEESIVPDVPPPTSVSPSENTG
jgi:hypothetical protein